jgi:predicted negative regulator of RcsB-dependent stress response
MQFFKKTIRKDDIPMKNNKIHQIPLEKTDFAEILEENEYFRWIAENGKNLGIAFFIIIALFFIGYRLTAGSMANSELQYIQAENDYQRFLSEQNSATQTERLQKLDSILVTHPELYQKFDGAIAQKLINEGKVTEALPFAKRSLERTEKENAPYFSNYSITTLLIAEKKYEQALQQSLALKQELLKNTSNDDLLVAFNLLRIATLQQVLNLETEELGSWDEWKLANESSQISKEAFQKLINYFNQTNVSLINYIEVREKILRKS